MITSNYEQKLVERLNPPPEGKAVLFDRVQKDFACFLDGEFICYRSTYDEGMAELREEVFRRLTHPVTTIDQEITRLLPKVPFEEKEYILNYLRRFD